MGWGGGGKRGDKERERRVKRGRSEGPSGISEVDRVKDWERKGRNFLPSSAKDRNCFMRGG